MEELTKTDLNYILTRLPKDVRSLIKKNKLIVAGGFIRSTIAGEKVSDIDIFGDDEEKLNAIAYKFATEREGRIHKTDNALTLLCPPRLPIQFITRWLFERPIDVALSFDFTVCRAAVWWENEHWRSYIDENFYPDLAARRLVYTYPVRNEDAGGSLLRVRNFLMRGYTIQAPSLSGVVARLVKDLNPDKINIEDEKAVSVVLCGLLREVDPSVIIDGVEIVDEHEAESEEEEKV
jgi:hypothetical protein